MLLGNLAIMPDEKRRTPSLSPADVARSIDGDDATSPAMRAAERVGPRPSENSLDSSRPSDRWSERASATMPTPRTSMIELDWLSEDTQNSRSTETHIQVPVEFRERNRASLTLITGLNAGQVFPLDGQSDVVIGRSREAHVRIDDVGISRQHSRVVQSLDGRFLIEDLGSTNGTFVGSRRVERMELSSGDHVQIGPNAVMRFALVDETEEKLAKQLYESSTRDPLTRAFNRKYFVERLHSEVAYALRHSSKLSILIFDLDHFKSVNDTYGHPAGDEVLRAVASRVTRLIRSEDVFARYGGEEFVLLVRGIEPANVVLFGERVRKSIEQLAITYDGQKIKATISLGIASMSEREEGERTTKPPGARAEQMISDELLVLADDRLYRAKSEGRNRVCSD